jgi:hypothetical protein
MLFKLKSGENLPVKETQALRMGYYFKPKTSFLK